MKPSSQYSKSGSSNSKSKKSSREREKRKSQGGNAEVNNHNSSEKGSPTKESSTRWYAGIDADSLLIYAEQVTVEQLSEEVSNTITEDINYRLRYMINDALIKARLSGRNAITSHDLEETFEQLRIDPVYGANSQPNWIPFGHQNLFYLEDKQINLIEIAEDQKHYVQRGETVITKKWISDQGISKTLRKYFVTMCQSVVNNDIELRKVALRNISCNSRIGPIADWFYNFGYILLSKDITYDCLTLRALDLIEALENSPVCRVNVQEKQLILLVRLSLQRLLKSTTTFEILKPMCTALSVLCRRTPLREFVILKILQKMPEVCESHALPVVTIIISLGAEALEVIFLPNLDLFLENAAQANNPHLTYSILELYSSICKENYLSSAIYDAFYDIFGDSLTASQCAKNINVTVPAKREINFVGMKCSLMKTRRKVAANRTATMQRNIDDVFEMPSGNTKLRKKLDGHKREDFSDKMENRNFIIGRKNLLLPVFHKKKFQFEKNTCCDHTLLQYNI